MIRPLLALSCALALAACQSGEESEVGAFDGIAESETIRLTGTEPFWGGEIADGTMTYTTPDNPAGAEVPVERFAGFNGLAFSGEMDGRNFDLTITPTECSDGMSDRTYPYAATLMVDGEQRSGCAWTEAQPFTGPENP